MFLGFGFGLFGYLQRYELYYVVFSIWIFEMIFSTIWLHYFKFGPLEWLWRSLTYRRMQPMRRTPPPPLTRGSDIRQTITTYFKEHGVRGY
ncbi:DUF418 domain-containing protein [Cyclobacterium salsum]|uniref:DUF418 domain-containing protein n=1 Tax=Cyclobacterium salsum TaxID=2666329 RepID=UPI0021CED06B|nr:DUF418 domain-containing protein [Cyclobacterium salsum]